MIAMKKLEPLAIFSTGGNIEKLKEFGLKMYLGKHENLYFFPV